MQELATVNGTSIWAGDGVHLTSNATRVAATRLMKVIIGGSETQEPATKRARLESVIPVRASPSPAAKAAQPATPPAPKPVPPPLWLSGQLPANQRGSSNQRVQPRGGRGGHIERGGQQAAGRARGHPPGSAQRRGQRRPPGPLGPVVKQNTREFCSTFIPQKMINGYCDTDKNFRENQQKVIQTEKTVLTRKLKIPT